MIARDARLHDNRQILEQPDVRLHKRLIGRLAFTVLAVLSGVAAVPSAAAQGRPPAMAQLTDWERRDLGVPPPRALHAGPFHGPTPNRIPGGQVVTTQGLVALLQQRETPVHLFHVLDWGETLPFAVVVPWAAAPGSFNDDTQRQLARMLEQVTDGDREAPLVFYCASADCWMSYNAAVRAIRGGHRNVLWYRGGLEAWGVAGLSTFRPGGGMAADGAGGPPMPGGARDRPPGAPPGAIPGAPSGPTASVGPPPPGGGGRRPPGALPPDAFGPDRGAAPRR